MIKLIKMNKTISEIKAVNFILPDKTSFLHINRDDVITTYQNILDRKDKLDINDVIFLYVAGQLGQNYDSNGFKPIIDVEKDFSKSPSELAFVFFQTINGGNLVEIYSQVSNSNKNYFWDLYFKTKTNTRVTKAQFKDFLKKQNHDEISYLCTLSTLLDIYPKEFISVLLSDYHYLPTVIELLWPATNLNSQASYKFPQKYFENHKPKLHSIVQEYVKLCNEDIDKAYILGIFIGNKKVDKFFALTPDEINEIKSLYSKYFATLYQISYSLEFVASRSESFKKAITCRFDLNNEIHRVIIETCPSKLKSLVQNNIESLIIELLFNPRTMHFILSDNVRSYSIFEQTLFLNHTGEYKSSPKHQEMIILAKCLFREIKEIMSAFPGSEFEIALFNFINNNVMSKIAEDNVRLQDEYNPKIKSSPISTLFISIETLIKAYNLFSNHSNKKVSFQELEYNDESPDFEIIKSITPCRHITINQNNSQATRVMNLLFAELYIGDGNGEYIKTLYDWIFKCGDISLLEKHDMNRINELKDMGLLEFQENKIVCNAIQHEILMLLKTLNDEGSFTFSTYRMREVMICAICLLRDENKFVTSDNNLFTQRECDFLNFMLNNKKYINSLALRNKHCHNKTYSIANTSDDYIYGLIILSFLGVTLSCDLKLKEEMQENEELMQNRTSNQASHSKN